MNSEAGRGRRGGALAAVLALVVGLLTVTATVAPAPDADAATVNIGTISAQMANHAGVNYGKSGNCITYAPSSGAGSSSKSSALVGSPKEAQTAHGEPFSGSCPSKLSTSTQSAIGFRPSSVASVPDGTPFLIGRMTHYNNPIYSDDEFFTGALKTVLGGFTGNNSLTFNWTLQETPNSGGGNCCDDLLSFNNQISDVTLTQGALKFRLVILGFVGTGTSSTCPASPSGAPEKVFPTVEGAQTHACLYAELDQLRSLKIVKNVVGSPPGNRSFTYTSTSVLDGSPWSGGRFTLASGGTYTQDLTSGNTVTVTETDPGDDRWSLTGLTCQQYNANGTLVTIAGATDLASRTAMLVSVPPPLYLADPSITCTYTNTYAPKSTLTLVKQVQGNVVSPTLWTLTATGSGAAAGTQISGPSGSGAVKDQRIAAGTYQLSELGAGVAETGFIQVGNWACAAGGTSYPVNTQGVVTLPDLPPGTTVTCTANNRAAVGSLKIAKTVDDPVGGYTGGATKAFSGNYDCGTGYTGTFSTLTTSTPTTITNIPAGRSCLVTETAPTGGLLNASFSWGAATYTSQPVTIADQSTATVTITNHVVQNFGTFSITKAISGPGGYAGGSTRQFPVNYSCTLTNGPSTAGTLNVTTAAGVSPAAVVPTGSVCTFTETPTTTEPGDFSDPSYVWGTPSLSPGSVTIGVNTAAAVTLTNTYSRQFGQLIITKVVDGDGYVGTGEPFVVGYGCGLVSGAVTLAPGGSKSVQVPAGSTCTVAEQKPSANLLDPAHAWGAPSWSPGSIATVPANGSVTLTVTNPTIAVFGKVEVTKAVTGSTAGVTSAASFDIRLDCDNGYQHTFTVGVGGTGTTPNLPVGTSCAVTESTVTGGLVDDSYAWGTPTVSPSTVTIDSPDQVVSVAVSNPVVRVRGQLSISKALTDPDEVVANGRAFAIAYSCVYGNDDPVTGTVNLAGGASETVSNLLLGSTCSITEDPAALTDPPSSTDPSYVWLPVVYTPGSTVTVASAGTPAAVTATNAVDQLESTFQLTKSVVGAGKANGYQPGTEFTFTVNCVDEFSTTVQLADGASWRPTDSVPVGTECTITETGKPDPTSPAYGWDPMQWSVGDTTVPGATTFTVGTDPIEISAINPITPRFGSVALSKEVTGETGGLNDGATFVVSLNCGPGLVYQLTLTDGGTTTQGNIPAGSTCTAVEASPDQSILADASYAWGAATYTPANATVAVAVGTTSDIQVHNPIRRVTAPVRLVKTISGGQGVVDPDRTFPVTWSCSYGGDAVGGTVNVTAESAGVQLSDSVLVTSTCTAIEGDLAAPSTDPAYRWLDPVITGVTVTVSGSNTITVANAVTRDSGTVLVRKQVTGATAGYVNLGDADAQDFTLDGSCFVPADSSIPTRYADGAVADGGEVPIVASIGWTCAGTEDTPDPNLLADTSYAWGTPTLVSGPTSDTAPPAPTATNTGPFVLTRDDPTIAFWAVNPIVRVSSTFNITKNVVDPFGAVDPATTHTGTYSCIYGTDAPVTGTWSLASGGTFTGPSVYLNSVCSVTEDGLGTSGLPDASYAWNDPVISDPVTVLAGDTATVTVTNTVRRVYAGLQVTKVLTDPANGIIPGATFAGTWNCILGQASYSGRYSVAGNASISVFTAADARVPATATCAIIEDTPSTDVLVDGSFGWDPPVYDPDGVTLPPDGTATLTVIDTVHRVYSQFEVRKVVAGPADGLVPDDRVFTGSLSCQYGDDDPVVDTWSTTLASPWVQDGILVGSTCSATENDPGGTGQPVAGDPSYAWDVPQVSHPVTVTPPTEANQEIVVTNPTRRVFGQFFISKAVSGATEGIGDRSQAYAMTYSCQPGTGDAITGPLDLAEGQKVIVGPGLDTPVNIPIGSLCTLTEPLDTMPPLVDTAWRWGTPTFTVEGLFGEPVTVTAACAEPVVTPCLGERSVVVTIPPPQENEQQPTVGLTITNPVERTYGSYTVTKSSDPPAGSVVVPGQTISYSVTVDSTGDVPVHDVVVTDDLSSVLPYATLGTITAPDGTTVTVDTSGLALDWTVGTVPGGESRTLTYQVTVAAGSTSITIKNAVTATGDTPPESCAEPTDAGCSTTHTTPKPPTISKVADGEPVHDPVTGDWTVGYRVQVSNPNTEIAVPYTLSDSLVFPTEVAIRSAAVVESPTGVTLEQPAWNGGTNAVIVTDAQLPGGATHTYRVLVVTAVPPGLTQNQMECAISGYGGGFGYFNSATVAAFGQSWSAQSCQPIPAVLVADKHWVVNGVDYTDGSQPEGFNATLTLDGVNTLWGTEYAGYVPGASVKIGEFEAHPASCTSAATGIGSVRMTQQLTSVTVTNVLTCAETTIPTTSTPPVITPTIPNTGFPLGPALGWGIGLLLGGALLLGGLALRGRRRMH